MDIHARVDSALENNHKHREGGTLAVVLLLLVLEYLREFFAEMRGSLTAIARMERKIMIDETAIKQHVQDSSDALASVADGVAKMREQLAVGNDTAVQSELDRIDALLSPVASRAKDLAASFNAPAPEPTPDPVTDAAARKK